MPSGTHSRRWHADRGWILLVGKKARTSGWCVDIIGLPLLTCRVESQWEISPIICPMVSVKESLQSKVKFVIKSDDGGFTCGVKRCGKCVKKEVMISKYDIMIYALEVFRFCQKSHWRGVMWLEIKTRDFNYTLDIYEKEPVLRYIWADWTWKNGRGVKGMEVMEVSVIFLT